MQFFKLMEPETPLVGEAPLRQIKGVITAQAKRMVLIFILYLVLLITLMALALCVCVFPVLYVGEPEEKLNGHAP